MHQNVGTKKFHVFNFNINNGLPKRLAWREESKKNHISNIFTELRSSYWVCFLFIHSLEPISFYFMWMADEKRMRMKARWICMFITICTRLLFSSCKLCSSFWLMAAPLVHAHQQIKSWFIASTITHKVAGTYLCNLFQHSAESLLCISWIWIYPHNIYVYCISLYVSVSKLCVHNFHFSFSHCLSFSRCMSPFLCECIPNAHVYCGRWNVHFFRNLLKFRKNCLWCVALCSFHSFRTSLDAHLHYRQVIC